MNVANILILLTVCAFVHVTSTKDEHGKHLKEKLHKKQVHRKAILHHGLHESRRNHKKIKEKNFPDRCQIVCPIILPPPAPCWGNAVHPISVTNSTARPQIHPTHSTTTVSDSTEEESTDESTESDEEETSPPPKITTKPVVKPKNSTRNQKIRIGASKKTRRHHVKRFYRLSKVQQKLLLKKLKLANRHGKKAYKFRNFNEFYCEIQCNEAWEPQVNIEPPEDGDEDDSDSDSYEEGEDTPIEATLPSVPDSFVVNGIKPFGPVDFIGLDDFGPNGELALDPYSYYEEKANVKRRKTRRGRKN